MKAIFSGNEKTGLSLSIANLENFKIVVECSTFFPGKGLLRRHRVYSLGLS